MASESSSPPAAEPIKPFEFAKVAPSVLQRVAGPVYTLWMLFMAWFGVIYLMLPCLPLVFVSPALFRKVMDAMGFYWYHVTVIFQRYVLGVRVVISGDPLPASDRAALFISNHRTRLDWLFLWNYFALNGRLLHEKIVLKAELKGFGPFGWAMQFLRFLFLKRDLAADARTMAEFFSAYADLRYPLQLLLFPEGTDLSPRTLQSSLSFAAKAGKPALHHCLLPRTGALNAALQTLRGRNLDAVYDLTIAYTGVVPQNETCLLTGALPREIHVHVRRHPAASMPEDELRVRDWATDRWVEKEQALRGFYIDNKTLTGQPRPPAMPGTPMGALAHVRCLLFFASYCIFFYIMYVLHANCWYIKWWTLFCSVFMIILTKLGGLDEVFEKPSLKRAFPESAWVKKQD